MEMIEPIVLIVIVFIIGYMLGGHHAIDTITDKIIEDPEGFINLIKNAKDPDKESLELHKEKDTIYCFGTNKGFLAQATDFDTLAREIRQALPDTGYIINSPQKDFTQDELYYLAKLLQKNVDNA